MRGGEGGGGTFDPVHNAHLILAEEARTWLNLSVVIFVPSGQPWLKTGQYISPTTHRLKMLSLAIAGKPHFELSTMEIERSGPSYTVNTIAELRGRFDTADEIFFILGWDNLAELPRWHEPLRLIKMCYLAAAPRPGYPQPDLGALEVLLPGISQRVLLLEKPVIDISATEIRQRVGRGLSIRHLVPEAVGEYIRQHRLYLT